MIIKDRNIPEMIDAANPCNVCSEGLRSTCESLGRCDTRDAWRSVERAISGDKPTYIYRATYSNGYGRPRIFKRVSDLKSHLRQAMPTPKVEKIEKSIVVWKNCTSEILGD